MSPDEKRILEWMERIDGSLTNIDDILLNNSKKLRNIIDLAKEIKDDMRFIKRTVNAHDDELQKLKNRVNELSNH